MARVDETKWTAQPDGSWTRMRAGNQETTFVNPNVTAGAAEAAAELGVDLASVEGTGKDGKITKADVEAAASG